ncbi:hypothetical protein SELMODRAFT_270563 [Selaginella moellendorffii]|uniref:F-box domain-containing protein n=1 Tax=Selaginella moellendorffii TaxID=88036 RepID=D8R5V6_SELML|nr:F-box protein 7 [Selaginella moellendorffii]EFJ32549.1 hypothetical protein SELMODRAFT_270563 [Selaginella moellendorffii]|eukprot:XP_002966522.1 F-box protein 7 [Selaginella moellendorffii]
MAMVFHPIINDTEGYRPVKYFVTARPWLDLYGTRIRPVAQSYQIELDPSLLHRKLSEDILHEIFMRLSPYTLGKASCVCRKWRYAIRNPVFWRLACLKTWQLHGVEGNRKILSQNYDGSWRKMWHHRPRLRFDGIYVSRNTYIRAGVAEWKVTNPVHLVCYYRYIRFFPNGRFLYKNTALRLKEIAKTMNRRATKENTYGGRYTLAQSQVDAAVVYPGLRPTVLRIRLKIRSTTPGANNRLDLLLLVTSGLDDIEVSTDEEILSSVENWEEDESHNPNVPAVTHKKGLAPFVFVPFEEVETSVLNLPVDTMDFYLPG